LAGDSGPRPGDEQGQIASLIQQLGDDDFFVRQRAQEELAKLGFEAYDALSAAEIHDDIEISSRARYLVERMRWTTPSDPTAVRQVLADYETASEDDRREAIRRLAELPPEIGIDALCRLVRYERSDLRSKLAAVALLEQRLPNEEDWQARSAAIDRALGESQRDGARWLRAYLLSHTDQPAAAQLWRELIEAETAALSRDPRGSHAEVLRSLLKIQVELLRSLGRQEEYTRAMAQVIELEVKSGGADKLGELIAWLTEQEAWNLVDDVATRFEDRIERNPLLLYSLAEARRLEGDQEATDELAARAHQQIRGGQVQHLLIALSLRQNNLTHWAEQELRAAVDAGKPQDANTLRAQFMLAEILHDRDDNRTAAEVLERAVDSMEKNVAEGNRANNADRPVGAIRARMLYFFSRDELEKDPSRSRRHLQEAVEADPTDADVLIALYHLPDQSPEERERVKQLIRAAADLFRQQISRAPDDATPYNQLAWLVGNTEGDFEEATRHSHKSLELRPDTPGYYDTLAHCYFAQQDYENAVRYQTKAVDGDPSSGLMKNKLKVFRDALNSAGKSKQGE
jgi:tetratricopeptide (TPR) repeat protein